MSKISEISDGFRNKNLAKNDYTDGKNEYTASNKDALSDGDERGKGDLNGSIGSKTDNNKRNEMTKKNNYTEGKNEYNPSNF